MIKLRLIHSVCDELHAWNLQKDIELPFVPWIGLEIADHDPGDIGIGYTIHSILWCVALNSFVARTKKEKWGNPKNTDTVKKQVHKDLEAYVESMLRDGWLNESLE